MVYAPGIHDAVCRPSSRHGFFYSLENLSKYANGELDLCQYIFVKNPGHCLGGLAKNVLGRLFVFLSLLFLFW